MRWGCSGRDLVEESCKTAANRKREHISEEPTPESFFSNSLRERGYIARLDRGRLVFNLENQFAFDHRYSLVAKYGLPQL
jgi:hypothetical protein